MVIPIAWYSHLRHETLLIWKRWHRFSTCILLGRMRIILEVPQAIQVDDLWKRGREGWHILLRRDSRRKSWVTNALCMQCIKRKSSTELQDLSSADSG